VIPDVLHLMSGLLCCWPVPKLVKPSLT
jgi:hypothetical protein